jgi:hypothetical protein
MKDFGGASQKVYLFLVYFSGVGTFLKIVILGLIWYQIDFQNTFIGTVMVLYLCEGTTYGI